MKEKPNDQFDWVTARHVCAVRTKFADLREAIKRDVARAAELRGFKFAMQEEDDDHLWIARDRRFGEHAVRLTVQGDGIQIDVMEAPDKTRGITASVVLNEWGECVFVVDGVQLTSVELRRRALDTLLFS